MGPAQFHAEPPRSLAPSVSAQGQASASGALQGGATITFTSPQHLLKNNVGTALVNETGVTVLIHAVSGALLATKTGHTTNASGLPAPITDPALNAGTTYRCIFLLASGAEGMEKVAAA